ncbi:integrase core domain protein [Trichuris suis]|nr:integrase core domain protein [Trichuris suis]
MVRTRGGKSESADIEQEPGSISGDDVKEENTGSAACEGQASAWQGRGGPWCQPPRMFSPSMDVEKPSESVADFADDLRRLGMKGGKGDSDKMEQFIMGLQSAAAQQHLIDKVPASFAEAVEITKRFLNQRASIEEMRNRRQVLIAANDEGNRSVYQSDYQESERQTLITTLVRIDQRLSQLEAARGDSRDHSGNRQGRGPAIRGVARNKMDATCFVCGTARQFARECPLRQESHHTGAEHAMCLMEESKPSEKDGMLYLEVQLSKERRVRVLDQRPGPPLEASDSFESATKRGYFCPCCPDGGTPGDTENFEQAAKTVLVARYHKHGFLQSVELPTRPFEILGIDHLGPFPLNDSCNRYIIVGIDYLTKWFEQMAVPDTTSQRLTDFIMKTIVLRHGVPKKLITDQGTAFTSDMVKEVLAQLKVQHGMASGGHPQSNGLVERANRTLSSILAAYVNSRHSNWDDFVPYAMFAMNTMDQSSTKISPFELIYGRVAVLPTDSCFPWPETAGETYEDFKKRPKKNKTGSTTSGDAHTSHSDQGI